MRRKLALLITFASLVAGILSFTFGVQRVKASETIYIKADGSVDPPTAPIDRVGNTYTFTDNINDEIVVEKNNTVVDGAGYTVQGTGSGSGITLSTVEDVVIKNMVIQGFLMGVNLVISSNITISGNTLTNNDHGIRPTYSSNNFISGNSITANKYYGIYLLGPNTNITISGNSITANDWHGIWVRSSSKITISGNSITANKKCGIDLYYSNNNTIYGNNITANELDGILISDYSNYNNVYGNNITDRIKLNWYSSYNSVYGNNIVGSGISLTSISNYNSISGNNITNSIGVGIYLWDRSDYNSIYGNSMTNNSFGIYIYLSSNNTIYHNNFINNTQQVESDGSTNYWDDGYPSGGNYWSNYTGVDLLDGGDGIGDSAHVIDENNTDRFPLMGSISFFEAGTWDETTYYVHTASNSTVSDFYFSEDDKLISFNVTGLDGTGGFCRVIIPMDLLWCEDIFDWTVRVNGTSVPFRVQENGDYTYIYFTYHHSIQDIKIIGTNAIPEFPTWTSMLLLLIVLSVALAICKRRLLKRSNQNDVIPVGRSEKRR